MSGTEVEAQVSKPWIVYLCSDWHLYIVQNIIEFDKNGSWNSFWLIPQAGIQNSSDCRAICAFIFIFFPPHLSLPTVAILFCSWWIHETA